MSKHSTKLRTEFRIDDLSALGVKFSRLISDSREVHSGDTFLAYPGTQADGRHFIAQAIESGANAVIWETHDFKWNSKWNLPNLGVRDLRNHAGVIADEIYGHPSRDLWMVGVTGTNGKTSISHWLAKTFNVLGKKSAVIGTLGNGIPGALQSTVNTTPDALLVHGLLSEYRKQEMQIVAMEVSSHALSQGRVNGVHYDVALLTNLTRDHLDFHGDMQSYAAAKRRLFEWKDLSHAVLNLDDAFGAELAKQLQDSTVEVVGYGLDVESLKLAEHLGIRMVYGTLNQMDAQGLILQLHTSWGAAVLKSKLIGRFNASNLLGTLAVLLVSEVNIDEAVTELSLQKAVTGRMQTLGNKNTPTVIVDFAHTPDALEKVLSTLREVTEATGGKVICVFGCGGDRDHGKRPMMGTVVSKLADMSIVTNDNPRSEEPQLIIEEIVSGMHGKYQVIEDRAKAITLAINTALINDTVLLAGKGHEDYQEVKGVRYPFSDSEIAHRVLSMWKPEEHWQ